MTSRKQIISKISPWLFCMEFDPDQRKRLGTAVLHISSDSGKPPFQLKFAEMLKVSYLDLKFFGVRRRCPGTREALEAIAGRRTLTAYTLFEALMRAVGSEGADEAAMDVDGVELTAAKLLDGQEPSKQEEDMWFHERSR